MNLCAKLCSICSANRPKEYVRSLMSYESKIRGKKKNYQQIIFFFCFFFHQHTHELIYPKNVEFLRMLYWHETQWCSNGLFSLNTLQRFDKLKSIIRDFHQTLHHTTKDIFILELWNFFFSSVFILFFFLSKIDYFNIFSSVLFTPTNFTSSSTKQTPRLFC